MTGGLVVAEAASIPTGRAAQPSASAAGRGRGEGPRRDGRESTRDLVLWDADARRCSDVNDLARGTGPRASRERTVDLTVVVVAAAALFGWGVLAHRLERMDLTAPIAFMGVGVALAAVGLVHGTSAPEAFTPLVEVTLVLV